MISDLSSSEEIFEQSKQYYQEALERSGHKYTLKHTPTNTHENIGTGGSTLLRYLQNDGRIFQCNNNCELVENVISVYVASYLFE